MLIKNNPPSSNRVGWETPRACKTISKWIRRDFQALVKSNGGRSAGRQSATTPYVNARIIETLRIQITI